MASARKRPRCTAAMCPSLATACIEVEAQGSIEGMPAEEAAPVGLAGFTVPACWGCAEAVRGRVNEICRGEEVTVRVVRLGASAYESA